VSLSNVAANTGVEELLLRSCENILERIDITYGKEQPAADMNQVAEYLVREGVLLSASFGRTADDPVSY
jgi:hypothetical protein